MFCHKKWRLVGWFVKEANVTSEESCETEKKQIILKQVSSSFNKASVTVQFGILEAGREERI